MNFYQYNSNLISFHVKYKYLYKQHLYYDYAMYFTFSWMKLFLKHDKKYFNIIESKENFLK